MARSSCARVGPSSTAGEGAFPVLAEAGVVVAESWFSRMSRVGMDRI